MNRECILEQAKQHDSFYLYEEAIIRKNTEQLKTDFPGVTFLYSVKCNPYPEVLRCVLDQGFGVDAASLAECVMGQKAGLGKDMVIFSAPGKTMADIRGGLGISTLVADSAAEVDRIVGLHAHLKSQELSAETLKGYYRNMFRLSVSMREAFGILKFVNLGSGMGIPFCETDKPFDTTALGAETQRLMAEFQEKLPETRFYIETGRYAVGTAGTYVAKVVDKKVTHGKNFVLLSATLNGFARPSMVAMLEHFMGNGHIAAWEPIYTGDHSFQMIPLVETAERETVTVTGNLCTGTDLVLSDADMPKMEVGDTVVFPNAGSYAAVISPMQFASQPKPAQLFLRADGTVEQDLHFSGICGSVSTEFERFARANLFFM